MGSLSLASQPGLFLIEPTAMLTSCTGARPAQRLAWRYLEIASVRFPAPAGLDIIQIGIGNGQVLLTGIRSQLFIG